jgi:hypothetical protein
MLSLAQGLHPWPQAQANLAEQVLVEGVPGDFIETGLQLGKLPSQVLAVSADARRTQICHYQLSKCVRPMSTGAGGAEVDGYRIGDDAAEEFSKTAELLDRRAI